jgi:hypothetical protein
MPGEVSRAEDKSATSAARDEPDKISHVLISTSTHAKARCVEENKRREECTERESRWSGHANHPDIRRYATRLSQLTRGGVINR